GPALLPAGRRITMLKRLCSELCLPHVQLGSFLLRLGLAFIFIFHGYLKLVVKEGAGWSDTLPETTQRAVAWAEVVCGGALLVGLLSRLASIGLIVIMVGAISLSTGKFDFINI